MRDEEFRKLSKRFFISTFFVLLFIIPFTIVLITKFGVNNTDIEKSIRNKETILLFITKKNCSRCIKMKNELEKNNILYAELNIDKTTINDYQRILRRIKISENDVIAPTLIYIEDGELISSLVDIKEKNDLLSYIENIS